MPLELDRSRLAVLGAEIGADYLNALACDLGGEVLFARMLSFHHRGVIRATCGLVASARACLRSRRRRVLGLGVGVQGMMDARQGVLRFSQNLGWHDVPLERLLRVELPQGWAGDGGLDLLVLNEGGAAALSEYVFGGEQQAGPLVYLDMGGRRLGLGDRGAGPALAGPYGLAGEVGRTILLPGGPPCTCGRRGHAEALISQRAVSRAATGRGAPVLGVAEFSARIARGDPAATAAASQAGSYLGMLIENLANTLNPETVVLDGTLCALGAPFVDTALRVMRENAGLHDHHHHTVRMGRFGLDAAALGAAGGVLQRLLNAAGALDASP